MKNIRRSFIQTSVLSIVALASTLASAAPLTYRDLMTSADRPTMAKIKEALPSLQEQFAGTAAGATQVDNWLSILVNSAPRLIAALEKAFPGQRYVFLGRDSAAIADAVEGFYARIGQHDRVVRIGVSKATFASANGDPSKLNDLLVGEGLDYAKVANGTQKGFIFVDTISKGYGNQGRQLLGAIFNLAQKNNLSVPALLPKINFMGLVVSTFGSGAQHPFEQAEAFIKSEQARYTQGGPNFDFFTQHQIVTYPRQPLEANEAGYEHYTYAWHGSYGGLVKDASGKTIATPGPVSDVGSRTTILQFQKKLLEGTSRDSFVASVNYEAMKLGYVFPAVATERENIRAFNFEGLNADELRLVLSENERVLMKESENPSIPKAMITQQISATYQNLETYNYHQSHLTALKASLENAGLSAPGAAEFILNKMASSAARDSIADQSIITALTDAIPTTSLIQNLVRILGKRDPNLSRLAATAPDGTARLIRIAQRYREQNPEKFEFVKFDRAKEEAAVKKELQKLIKSFEKADIPQAKQYFTQNAKSLSQWLATNLKASGLPREDILIMFLAETMNATRAGKVNGKDSRRLVAQVIAEGNGTDAVYMNRLHLLVVGDKSLRTLLSSKAWSFAEGNSTRNGEVLAQQFELVRRHILTPLNCELQLTRPE